ncbi:glycosyltransferase [Nitrosovibrio sp. Nv17]|uniref:glycosyltransferase n=1 Tax=Nitrosovibrio sp. Nv17 TaxID=1855339 RepID=UPI0009089C8F|nr:glycosyltransferase [Nitrosovibrio sp. Nv17]SFW14207.1 Glycosyl transferase family 2 [Nitrosovibrio sp. Nv17]
MRLSIVIPAFNEERLIGECLRAVFAALAANSRAGVETEVIVVDNNSTDDTARLAREGGARVVFEPVNQIGRARNAGAAAATGDWLVFVDADSILSPGLLADILALIESGRYVGCGSVVRMRDLPWWAGALLWLWTCASVLCRWAAGALVVCRSDAFRDAGGFNQALYAGDEVDLSRRLKRWGRARGLRFTILRRHPLDSSPRKIHLYSAGEVAWQILRVVLQPRRALQSREKLPIWYDGRR